jgi:ribonuclease HII
MQKKYENNMEIGIDEAGRGPLIGRVYAAAVIWPENLEDKQNIIIDSKKLNENKRKIALKWIKENVTAWGVGFAEPSEIDEHNILEATKMAMQRAVENLKTNFNTMKNSNNLIIDGINWNNKFPNYNVTSIVKGDDKFLSIAAASIIAKEYHDDHIKQLCNINKELDERYDLTNNKGYGTKKHILGIEKYGVTIYHRKSFRRCK